MNDAFDAADDSVVLGELHEALAGYVADQQVVAALRDRPQPQHPWPDRDNVMLDFLIRRGGELLAEHGPDAALVWLAVHAWREATLLERARLIHGLQG